MLGCRRQVNIAKKHNTNSTTHRCCWLVAAWLLHRTFVPYVPRHFCPRNCPYPSVAACCLAALSPADTARPNGHAALRLSMQSLRSSLQAAVCYNHRLSTPRALPLAPRAQPTLHARGAAGRARVALAAQRPGVGGATVVEAVPSSAAPPGFFVDEEALLGASTFPIPPAQLIEKCKACLLANFGCSQPELLAPNFQFVAPVVGPLSKQTFVQAFNSFDILEAFPDMQFRYHHLRVDPYEPSRVWYTARAVGTHTGPFAKTLPATGKRVDSPPQSCSMCFNEQGQCTQLTVGYVMDRQLGNTGGLGAVFGILYAIGYGLPFPEAQPWQISWQYKARRLARCRWPLPVLTRSHRLFRPAAVCSRVH